MSLGASEQVMNMSSSNWGNVIVLGESQTNSVGVGSKFFRTSEKVYAALGELASQRIPLERDATIAALCKRFSTDEATVLTNQLLHLLARQERKGIAVRIWDIFCSGFLKLPIWRPSAKFTQAHEGRVLKPALAILLGAFVVLFVTAALKGFPSLPSLAQFSWQNVLSLWCAFTLTTVWHELGHVALAAHYGVRTRDVGIGLFYLQPVGYADVTEAWIKPARIRAVIALGCILFEAVPLLLIASAWILTQHHLLGAYTLLGLLGIFFNLIPFVRLDGYWLLCHLLDQHNLRERSLAHLRYLLTRRGQPQFVGAASGFSRCLCGLFLDFCSRPIPECSRICCDRPWNVRGKTMRRHRHARN